MSSSLLQTQHSLEKIQTQKAYKKGIHALGTINELGIYRSTHGDHFMLAFPCAKQVPGKGLIRIPETITFKGKTRLIHPFYTDHKALLHMDKII
jgi:hypothetical protein